jgi:uncharacterized protein YkvS
MKVMLQYVENHVIVDRTALQNLKWLPIDKTQQVKNKYFPL